ncbi:hypothetical protein [Oxynema aestuarii]|uniref:PatU n=1 Tax=Oxynema aestuarii AP17 TaxID=2064643 RepID=A0A6H1U3W0_9CYAN|nr:hypothetical protein [Oxynema aestuarii]QIZ72840.1 hypothetical protein HCG48_21405 [Oxynema aestuarii AP17]
MESRDAEAFERIQHSKALQQQLLEWLLSENRHPVELSPPGTTDIDRPFDPLDSETFDDFLSGPGDIEAGIANPDESPLGGIRPHQPGEIPAVQDRYYALLKRRLQTEIQHHLPLFPWENEVLDYDAETSDWSVAQQVPDRLWTAQLEQLNLPVTLPPAVLTRIFEQCRRLVNSSVQEGLKLVRAVEDLFPEQTYTLHQLAGTLMVAGAPQRSTDAIDRLSQAAADFPETYEAASPTQQMVMSLLAAREIVGSLTLSVRAGDPPVQRQWLTGYGTLELNVEYTRRDTPEASRSDRPSTAATSQAPSCLRVAADLPCGGRLTLEKDRSQGSNCRSDAGSLSVEVQDPQPHEKYFLKVELDDPDSHPLIFTVYPLDNFRA